MWSSAFFDCGSLASINIPESVTNIGYNAFAACDSLAAVHIPSIEAWCNIKFEGNTSNPLYYAKNLYVREEKKNTRRVKENPIFPEEKDKK